MKLALTCCLLTALLAVGCRKKPATTGADPSTATGTTPTAPKGEFTPAPAVPADSPAAKAHREMDQKLASGNVQLQLQVLDELLQAWIMSQNAPPKDLEEFVRTKMLLKLPSPPAGKRFAIDPKSPRVVLINQ